MAKPADLERLFERIFERSTARLFGARLQPVQLARHVERAMERARTVNGNRTDVPARYRVRLQPVDLAQVSDDAGGVDVLAARLADAALTFARSHAYHLPGRPVVTLVADPAVARGVVEVDTAAQPVERVGPPAAELDRPAAPEPAAEEHAEAPAPVPLAETPAPLPALAVAAVAPGQAVGGIRGDGTETLVFRRPAPPRARAVLRIMARDGSEQTIEVDGSPLTVGRAADNALVLADVRVSRHHARLQTRHGTLVFTDLGSTNGSRVNGVRIDECALGIGDRVLVGDTVLLVEQLPA
jgi:hypothetical protein